MQSMLKLLAVCEKNADYTLKKGMFPMKYRNELTKRFVIVQIKKYLSEIGAT